MIVTCTICKKEFELPSYRISTYKKYGASYCSTECLSISKKSKKKPIVGNCSVCGKHAEAWTKTEKARWYHGQRIYCSPECLKESKTTRGKLTAKNNFSAEKSSERMKINNPMNNPKTVQKMVDSSKGRTFLSRGGNGQPTKQQLLLHEATGFPMEYPISCVSVKDLFESVPKCYKVDLAVPDIKLSIEVDGKTHQLKKWKFLDKRKTEILNAMGWDVLRFKNEEIDQNMEEVMKKLQSTISKLRKTKTIL